MQLQKELDERYMQEALTLAKRGWGKTGINPLVGAVIVKNGRIAGKGFHRKLGEAHAEVGAIVEAGRHAQGATLYVNLEPCSCAGRTPPCVEAISKAGIKRVVIGMVDPNPAVNGKGIQFLQEHNIDVTLNVLNQEAGQLNLWYTKYIIQKIPYVIVKIALSQDGRITNFKEKYITTERSRRFVHSLRSQVSAVLVGINTIVQDNPYLTDRLIGRNNPARIVLDPHLRMPLDAHFLNKNGLRIIITGSNNELEKMEKLAGLGVEFITLPGDYYPMEEVLQKLGARDIGSILIEGGGIVFSEVLNKKLYDELYIFVASKIIGKGANFLKENSQEIQLEKMERSKIGEDYLYHVYRHS